MDLELNEIEDLATEDVAVEIDRLHDEAEDLAARGEIERATSLVRTAAALRDGEV